MTAKIESTITVTTHPALAKFLAERPLRRNPASMFSAGDKDSREKGVISESVALDRLAERYQHLLQKNFPKLTEPMWHVILNAYQGQTEHGIAEMHPIFNAVCDDVGLEPWDEESKSEYLERVKASEFGDLTTLLHLSGSEVLVVHEFVERFWGRKAPSDKAPLLSEQLANFSGLSPEDVFAC